MSDITHERATVTVDEAATILGLGRSTTFEAVRMGRIPSIKLSPKRILIPRAALERILSGEAPEVRK